MPLPFISLASLGYLFLSLLFFILRLLYYPLLLLLCSILLTMAVGGARAYIESSHVSPSARERLQHCTQHLFSDHPPAGRRGKAHGGGPTPPALPALPHPNAWMWRLAAAPCAPLALAGALALALLAAAAYLARRWALPLGPLPPAPLRSAAGPAVSALAGLRWEARALLLCLVLAAAEGGRRAARKQACGACACGRRGGQPQGSADLPQPASAPVQGTGAAPGTGPDPASPPPPPAPATAPTKAAAPGPLPHHRPATAAAASAAAPMAASAEDALPPPSLQASPISELNDVDGRRAAAAALRAAERAARRASLLHTVAQHANMATVDVAQGTPLAALLRAGAQGETY